MVAKRSRQSPFKSFRMDFPTLKFPQNHSQAGLLQDLAQGSITFCRYGTFILHRFLRGDAVKKSSLATSLAVRRIFARLYGCGIFEGNCHVLLVSERTTKRMLFCRPTRSSQLPGIWGGVGTNVSSTYCIFEMEVREVRRGTSLTKGCQIPVSASLKSRPVLGRCQKAGISPTMGHCW